MRLQVGLDRRAPEERVHQLSCLVLRQRGQQERRGVDLAAAPARPSRRAALAGRCRGRAAAPRVAQSTRWSTKSSSTSSAQCRSSKTSTSGRSSRDGLQESPPGGERLVRSVPEPALVAVEPRERPKMALDPGGVRVLGDEPLHGLTKLRCRCSERVGLEDAGLRLDHLAERPEGDRPRRTAASGRCLQKTSPSRSGSIVWKSSKTSRLLPMPGTPTSVTSCGSRSAATRATSSEERSSCSRPTSGVPPSRSTPTRAERARRARPRPAATCPWPRSSSRLCVLDRPLGCAHRSSRRRGCRSVGAAA